MRKTGKCCFCGKPFDLYGNSPDPVDMRKNARCCDSCDTNIVIPARIGYVEALREGGDDAAAVFLGLTRIAAANHVFSCQQ